MVAIGTQPDAGPGGEEPEGRSSPLRLAWRVGVAVVVVASFGVWAYAFSGQADRPPPDSLADTGLAARAEAICAAAVTDVERLPSAFAAADGPERADQVRAATDRYEEMVDDLASLEAADDRDRLILDGWLGDWRTLLEDRRRYADAVAVDPGAVFLQTDTGRGRIDRQLTRVATANAMPSCGAPGDVG